jgi:ABC-type lipoprotein release transport system permease subunit
MYLTLAWRNIWRNKRRSLISISSVLLAVVLALLTRSFQYGFYDRSIDNVVSFYTGYIQIHARGFWDNQSLEESFGNPDSLAAAVRAIPHVTEVTPRLSTYALVATDSVTDVGMVVGIEPESENRVTGLGRRVVTGRYLQADDAGIMLARGLAEHLRVQIGDTIVILGQGYHGATAAGTYSVSGIVSFPTPEMDNSLAYLTLGEARRLTMAEDRATAIVVMIDGQRDLPAVMRDLKRSFGQRYEIMTWENMMPELVQAIETDNAGGLIMVFIIYMVIGFGILGTILMMTLERTHEFGMLMAVGMKRSYLAMVSVIESVMLSLAGVAGGVILGIPIMYYFHANPIRMTGAAAEATLRYGFEPIMPTSLDPMIVCWQALTILVIALLADLYPLSLIFRLDAVTAMRKA